jgi:ribosomal protein S27AE
MAEQRLTANVYAVRYACDKCHVGEMEQLKTNGSALIMDQSMSVPKWRHQCNKCGDVQDLEPAYPQVRFDVGPMPGPNQ